MTDMTQTERNNLAGLARKRAKVAKSMIGERVKVLRAEVEDQLSAEHKVSDELWADIARTAADAVAVADAHVAARCAELGIAENLRPSLKVVWQGRGENAQAERRAELRKLAHARIDAAGESAKVYIDAGLLEVETALVADGLTSADAVAFLNEMPTVEVLMPTVEVGTLSAVDDEVDDRTRRWHQWEPSVGAVAAVLTPTTASGRKAKQDAVARALAANPDASNRAIARAAGVDHKTVGALRSGESPQPNGEVPQVEELAP